MSPCFITHSHRGEEGKADTPECGISSTHGCTICRNYSNCIQRCDESIWNGLQPVIACDLFRRSGAADTDFAAARFTLLRVPILELEEWSGEEKVSSEEAFSYPHTVFTDTVTTALDTWLEMCGGHQTDDVTACLSCPLPPPGSCTALCAHKPTSAAQKKRHIHLSCGFRSQLATLSETRQSSGRCAGTKRQNERWQKVRR